MSSRHSHLATQMVPSLASWSFKPKEAVALRDLLEELSRLPNLYDAKDRLEIDVEVARAYSDLVTCYEQLLASIPAETPADEVCPPALRRTIEVSIALRMSILEGDSVTNEELLSTFYAVVDMDPRPEDIHALRGIAEVV